MSNRNANDEAAADERADGTDRPRATDPRAPGAGTRTPTESPAGGWTWAWRTFVALLCVTLLMAILAWIQNIRDESVTRIRDGAATLQPRDLPEQQTARVDRAPSFSGLCELERQAVERWQAFRENLLRERLQRTERAIQDGLDAAFDPVYGRIPKFLDWHYSIIGQYTELGQAAAGRLQQELEARLFSDLQQRIDDASTNVDLVMQDEMRTLIDQWVRMEGQRPPTGVSTAIYQDMLDMTIPQTVRRFGWSAPPSAVVAVGAGAGGKAAATALGKTLAKKLMASAAVKTAGKVAVKLGSLLPTAATGAAVGSVLGPPGAAIGGVVAGVAAWLALDSAVVNIDEHLNRSALEQDLVELVDGLNAEIRTALSDAVEEAKSEALEVLDPAQAGFCIDDGNDPAPPLPPVSPSELDNLD